LHEFALRPDLGLITSLIFEAGFWRIVVESVLNFVREWSVRSVYIRALSSRQKSGENVIRAIRKQRSTNPWSLPLFTKTSGKPLRPHGIAFNWKASDGVYVVAPIEWSCLVDTGTGNRLEFLSSCVSNSAAWSGDFL